MLSELVGAGVLGAAGAFGAYWYLKFRDVLPMESALRASQRALHDFTSFTRDTMERAYAPEQPEHYGDIANYYLIKLHKVFPESCLLVFEKGDGQWRLVNYLKHFKAEPKLLTSYKWSAFDRSLAAVRLLRRRCGLGADRRRCHRRRRRSASHDRHVQGLLRPEHHHARRGCPRGAYLHAGVRLPRAGGKSRLRLC